MSCLMQGTVFFWGEAGKNILEICNVIGQLTKIFLRTTTNTFKVVGINLAIT